MTPPVFLVPVPALVDVRAGDVVTLSGSEGRHAVGVLRLLAGEWVVVVDGEGRRVTGSVLDTSGRDTARISVATVQDEAPPQPRIVVVQALPKGDRGELAVELLTEIGVDVIVPWAARNCVAHWRGDRAERGHRRWVDATRAAGKQSRRSRFPEVAPLASTSDVADRIASAELAIVLHETATAPIGAIALPTAGEVVLVVGPEGGLTPEEVARFGASGAVTIQLGPTVLRTSSAGIAAAAALLSRSARWGGDPGVTG